jgi:PAS domain S-box-containing protein
MRIESLSTKTATIAIFTMIAAVAIVLSLLAASYFRQSALDAQMNSLSRVIEVATQEMLKKVRNQAFDLGMKLGHSRELVQAFRQAVESGQQNKLAALLDDPFITGFAGFSRINLVKLRVYTLELEFIGESSAGIKDLELKLPLHLQDVISDRDSKDRLKAVDALWLSSKGPLLSAVVPLGGLRPVGYLEVIVDPVFNLPEIGKITQTPVSVYSMAGRQVNATGRPQADDYLPVEYILHTSDGTPAFRIVGLENVQRLNAEMQQTQVITISGFLLLALSTLLFALWLFNRFMLSPLSMMAANMRQMAQGKLDYAVKSKGLSEFSSLAGTFNVMAEQVRLRAFDLERLLDLDDSAIVCFDNDREMVFFNKAATALFGYSNDELNDLDLNDLFVDDVPGRMTAEASTGNAEENRLHTLLLCKHKDGREFKCDSVINALDVMGQKGHAIALNSIIGDEHLLSTQNEQRLEAVEQSLESLLDLARTNPSLIQGMGNISSLVADSSAGGVDKAAIREQAVSVMNLALACWEQELGKSKLDLAEQSKIWPVYIDKSTPTTRTLDKYLSLNNCPKNPRSQRVLDTAEFVLREVGQQDSAVCDSLRQKLNGYRELLSGVKVTDKSNKKTSVAG